MAAICTERPQTRPRNAVAPTGQDQISLVRWVAEHDALSPYKEQGVPCVTEHAIQG